MAIVNAMTKASQRETSEGVVLLDFWAPWLSAKRSLLY